MRFFSSLSNGFLAQPTWKSHPHLLKNAEILPGVTKESLQRRIDRLAALLPPKSICLIPAYRTRYASQNIFYPFHQNNNLYYLTGFNEPNSCLVLEKSSDNVATASMFVEPNNPEAMLWTGPRAGAAGFQDFFGLQNVYDRKGALAELVDSIARDQHRVIFLDHNENSFLGPELLSSLKRAKPLSELMHQLRLKKQPEELNLLRKSAQIAAEALTDSLRFSVTPIAKGEGCVAAHMEYRAKILGADRLAYVPVVARGDHALILHYVHNNQHFQDRSQLLLMDAGAQYFGYCSDITRTWPLSRRFTLPQRKLYEAVLNVQKGCLAALKVADKITLDELNDVSIYLTAAELDRLGFKNVQRHVNRLFPHSIGHHLGLDLHDCPTHKGTVPLEKGNVITVEPGIYVPYDSAYPAEYQGLGIRIEDDVIIGENGDIEVITSSVPSDPDAVESLLSETH